MEETLKVRLTADTTQYKAAMEAAKEQAQQFKAETDNLKIKAQFGDEMADAAQKAGLSFKDIQERVKATADAFKTDMGNAAELVQLKVGNMAKQQEIAALSGETLAAAEETAGVAAEGMGAAMSSALGPIGLVIGAIAAVVAAYQALKAAQDKLLKGAAKVAGGIVKYTAEVVKAVDGSMVWAFKQAVKGVQALIDKVNSGDLDNLYNWARGSGNAVADSMDRISSALLTAKNGVAALVAPLVNTLAPVLDWIVDKFVTLVNAVNKFFAALGGKATYIAVQKAAVSYGDAAAGAMDNATDSAKAYKRELLGFDEINKLPEPDTGSGSGGNSGGGAGGSGAGSMFTELSTEGKSAGEIFNDFLDKIEAGLPAFHEKLQNAAKAINDWAKNFRDTFADPQLQARVTALTEKLVDELNNFVERVDFNMIGRALGTGINTALNVITTAIQTFKWTQLGDKLAGFVNGLVDEINPTYLGKLLTDPWNIAWKTLYGFVTGLDWKGLATKVAETLNEAFKNLDVDSFVGTIEGALSGATVFLKELNLRIKWNEMGDKVADMIYGLSKAIADNLPDLIEAAVAIAKKLGSALSEALGRDDVKAELVEAAKALVKAAFDLKSAEGELKNTLSKSLAPAIAAGIGQAIVSAYDQAPDWIKSIIDSLTGGKLSQSIEVLKMSLETKGKEIGASMGTGTGDGFKTGAQGKLDTTTLSAVKPAASLGNATNKKAFTSAGTATANSYKTQAQTTLNGATLSAATAAKKLTYKATKKVFTSAGKTDAKAFNSQAQATLKGASYTIKSSQINNKTNKTNFATAGKELGQRIGTALQTALNNLNLTAKITATGIAELQGKKGSDRGNAYASGGWPDTGQAFIARESGPELVGTIGGRTAVATNADIVAAVSQGVAAAVSSVMGSGGGATEVNVYMDRQKVAQAANRGNALLNRRFSVFAQ